jgi:beta-lactamase regulating signal transducer with metallopeptidase domain
VNVDAFVHDALRWSTTCGGGALVLAAVASVFDRACGARRPQIASALWWAVLVRLVLPPSFGSPFGVALPRRTLSTLERGVGDVDVYGAFEASGVGAALLAVWFVGAVAAALIVARRVAAERRTWARVERRQPGAATRRVFERVAVRLGVRSGTRSGVRPLPDLALVDGHGAALVGLVRPWIALPAALERDDRRAELEAVLAHELAHFARRDGWRRVVALVCCVLFWFHPAAWCAARRLAALAEFACDRAAVRASSGGVAACRAALLEEVRTWFAPRARADLVASSFVRPPSLVLARFAAIESPRHRASRPRREALLASVAFGAAFLTIAPALPARDVVPPLESLDGCLQQRHAVMALYAHALADGRVDEFLASTSSKPTR